MDWNALALQAGSGILTNIASGLFNANQAAKNRAFQERMYERQYEDSIKFWNLQNQYALPSAQKQRLVDANLNPMLMYGQGGISQTMSSSQPNLPSQPSGSQASAAFSNPLEVAQYALLDAEREKKKAETRKLNAESENELLNLRFGKDTYGIRMAIMHHDDERLQVEMQKMRNEIVNSGMVTSQQVQTMIQARQYEIKRFNLDESTYGTQLAQGWKSLSIQQEQNKIAWGNLAALWARIRNETNMTNWQVGRIAFDIVWDSKMNPLKMRGLTLDNMLKRWDTHLRKATLSEKQADIVTKNLENYYYNKYGSKTPFEYKYFQDVKAFSNDLISSFTLPKIHL